MLCRSFACPSKLTLPRFTSHPIFSTPSDIKARVVEERDAVYIGDTVNATGVCTINITYQLTSFLTLSSFASHLSSPP